MNDSITGQLGVQAMRDQFTFRAERRLDPRPARPARSAC